MIDLEPWACTCGQRFPDTHAAITIDTARHQREASREHVREHVIRKLPRRTA